MTTDQRTIRVFISSTFRDMQEERDLLIKKISPQLRKICEERAVTWTEVDLRWGITDEQKAEGKVLPLCLEEIHRCRPYFIGLLGNRYGWVPEPNSIPTDLLESQAWLKQHLRQSVTELEILHGVFNEKSMHGHAYFYFRDPKYLESIPADWRQDFTSESAEAAGKLAKLKQKIRGARDEQICKLREGYANPEQLGEWILQDFTQLIDRLYPKDQTPDPLDQEAARHEAYARSRRLAFVGREDLLRRLDEHCGAPVQPLVLTGDPGCGKSALLAEWVARWRRDRPEDLIIQHYIGSTPDSGEWQGLVRRVLGELKRAFGLSDDIPAESGLLRDALGKWTAKLSDPRRRVVLVLDALNQLAEEGAARPLDWLPSVFPASFSVLVSTVPGKTLDVLRNRAWLELSVPLFVQADIAPAALAYLKVFSKTLPADIVAQLESTPAARNALYLRAVLDELRQFGKHGQLKTKASEYLSAPDLPALFDRILARWDDDFGRDPDHPDLVRRALGLIACARYGLSETELLDLLATNRRAITPFFLAAENSLTHRAGLVGFSHEHLRLAVNHRYFSDATAKRDIHVQLANYFEGSEDWECRHLRALAHRDRRCIGEHPWHLVQAEDWERLGRLLCDLNFITVVWLLAEPDLLNYCAKAEANSAFSLNVAFCGDIREYLEPGKQRDSDASDLVTLNAQFQLKAPPRYVQVDVATGTATPYRAFRMAEPGLIEAQMFALSGLLRATGHWEESRTLRRMLLDFNRHTGSADSVQAGLHNLAIIEDLKGNVAQALTLHEEEEHICREIGDREAIGESLRSIGIELRKLGRHEEALVRFREAQRLAKERSDPWAEMLALGDQANVFLDLGEPDKAEPLLRAAMDLQRTNGVPETVEVITMMATLHQARGDHRAALRELSRAAAAYREHGQVHELGISLHNMALCYHALEDFAQALESLREEEHLCRQLQDQPSLAANLHDQARIAVRSKKSPEVALRCLREALDIQKDTGTAMADRPEWLVDAVFLCAQTTDIVEAQEYIRELGNCHPPPDRVEAWVAAWLILATECASRQDYERAKSLLAQASLWCAGSSNADLRQKFEEVKTSIFSAAAPVSQEESTAHTAAAEAKALHHFHAGEWAEAFKQAKVQRSLAEADGDLRSVASALTTQGWSARRLGHFAEALDALDRALALFEELGCQKQVLEVQMGRALVVESQGDRVRALEILGECESVCRRLRLPEVLQACIGNKAAMLADCGEYSQAAALLREQQQIASELGDGSALAKAILNSAILAINAIRDYATGIPELVAGIRASAKHGLMQDVRSPGVLKALYGALRFISHKLEENPYADELMQLETLQATALIAANPELVHFAAQIHSKVFWMRGDGPAAIGQILAAVEQCGRHNMPAEPLLEVATALKAELARTAPQPVVPKTPLRIRGQLDVTLRPSISYRFLVTAADGLDAGSCCRIVETFGRLQGEVSVRFGEQLVDAKSIMNVAMLCAPVNSVLEVRFETEVDLKSVNMPEVGIFLPSLFAADIECPRCKHVSQSDVAKIGQTIQCRKCGGAMLIDGACMTPSAR